MTANFFPSYSNPRIYKDMSDCRNISTSRLKASKTKCQDNNIFKTKQADINSTTLEDIYLANNHIPQDQHKVFLFKFPCYLIT